MQRARFDSRFYSVCVSLFLIILLFNSVSAQDRPRVPGEYQRFFVHYVDKRSIWAKALNLINVELRDIGRSFALVAGVSHYSNMQLTKRSLKPAAVDIKQLQGYLEAYEFFDEIVVLKDGDVTTENLEFFLQTYFPNRLRKFPKSRFLFAYSGHGMTEGGQGYLLKNTARNLRDKANSINLGVIRVLLDEVVRSGHHVLVLLNACYSGAFLRRSYSFGGEIKLIPRNPGAHAITAGGTGEVTWAVPEIGDGSVFFTKVFAGLDGRADTSDDGIVTVYELFSYLKREVQISTDQDQNPQVGDLSIHGSKGEFFFLNRDRQVAKGILPHWMPDRAIRLGGKAESALVKGKQYLDAKQYDSAFLFFRQSAKLGNNSAKEYIAWLYENGLGVEQDRAQAVRFYREAAEAGSTYAMVRLANIYKDHSGNKKSLEHALYWYQRAAEAGELSAMHNLGYLYETRMGNTEKAVYWWERAANAGSTFTMKWLGSLYGGGYPRYEDYDKAAYWYRRLVDYGDLDAVIKLGNIYKLRKSYNKAAFWYRKAVEAGDNRGMIELGRMYRFELENYDKAEYWYKRWAETGDPRGMYWLGNLYSWPLSKKKDYDEAERWLRKAANAGDRDGMCELARLHRYMFKNYDEAKLWYQRLAKAGDSCGMAGLGDLYLEGKGVHKDYHEAKRWFRKAASLGNPYAKDMLKKLNEKE